MITGHRSDKGDPLLGTKLHTLGYADDTTLVDLGDAAGVIKPQREAVEN